MKKQLLLYLVILSIFTFLGVYFGEQRGYQDGYNIGWQKGQDAFVPQTITQNITEFIDREVVKEIIKKEYYTYLVPNSRINLDQVLTILALGEYNHLYYVSHPGEQNYWTGNTTSNQEWAQNYEDIEDYIKAQQNEIVRLAQELKYWKPEVTPPITPPVSPPR